MLVFVLHPVIDHAYCQGLTCTLLMCHNLLGSAHVLSHVLYDQSKSYECLLFDLISFA